jgi:hypothetical protein
MNMKQCEQGGHFYDASVHQSCPYCTNSGVGATIGLTKPGVMPAAAPVAPAIPVAQPLPVAQPVVNHNYAQVPAALPVSDVGRTVAIMKEDIGIDPVVGWLVCMSGKDKGRDFRIHSDNNYIGRSDKMDICIRGDDTVSRDNHAVISYDPREKIFYFTPGDGRSIVRLNEKGVFSTTELKKHDLLEVGKTILKFIPLCGEDFDWTDKDE